MTDRVDDHEKWMRLALKEGYKALEKDEVPVGAVVVYDGKVIGRGHNLVETLQDPIAHAEVLAITAAANVLASWRLTDCILYVTLEPCMMCAGAILFSRVAKVVYGADDPRYGAAGSKLQLLNESGLDVKTDVVRGVLQKECSDLIREFFRAVRQQSGR